MLCSRWLQKMLVQGALARTEEVKQRNKDTMFRGVTMQICHPHQSLHCLLQLSLQTLGRLHCVVPQVNGSGSSAVDNLVPHKISFGTDAKQIY